MPSAYINCAQHNISRFKTFSCWSSKFSLVFRLVLNQVKRVMMVSPWHQAPATTNSKKRSESYKIAPSFQPLQIHASSRCIDLGKWNQNWLSSHDQLSIRTQWRVLGTILPCKSLKAFFVMQQSNMIDAVSILKGSIEVSRKLLAYIEYAKAFETGGYVTGLQSITSQGVGRTT